MNKINDMSDQDILSKITGFYRLNTPFTVDGKASSAAEAERMLFVNEAHKRNLIGYKSKKKYRSL